MHATKTARLAAASGSPIHVEGDATLEFVRDGEKCNMKFLDADGALTFFLQDRGNTDSERKFGCVCVGPRCGASLDAPRRAKRVRDLAGWSNAEAPTTVLASVLRKQCRQSIFEMDVDLSDIFETECAVSALVDSVEVPHLERKCALICPSFEGLLVLDTGFDLKLGASVLSFAFSTLRFR